MSYSEIAQIGCAFAAIIVAVVIGCIQANQNKKMRELEERLDRRDEERRSAGVRASAISFISKYYSDRGLIPLCAMAMMHNPLFYYNREMYREFCCLTNDVQARILEYSGLDLQVVGNANLFSRCLQETESLFGKAFVAEDTPFYDRGKYLWRSLEPHGSDSIPAGSIEYEIHIIDAVQKAFDRPGTVSFRELRKEYSFEVSPECEACHFALVVARALVNIEALDDSEMHYGSPGAFAGETIDTMEDLFLLYLFDVYTKLMLGGNDE